ncbi:efflux RND transporter periplasmic adaptor subunit [Virgibacillus xinjiangensis]|uniref:Efflux RND transporter periplasmic adaptor subunit n=1 Tax=Virgibacillus xinjiangensis TaxID=393090 RepID=A0ABV7CVQ4_9BACI
MKKWLFGILAVLMIAVLAACTEEDDASEEETEEDAAVAVETAEVREGDLVVDRSASGRTSPSQSAPVMLQAPGEVDTLEVSEGEQVEEDDVIAKIATQAGIQNIRAPRDGEVMNLAVQEGDMATAEEPLAIIADMNEMTVEFTVTAEVRDLLTEGDVLDAVIEGETYEAEVVTVRAMPDDTGLYPVEATIPNEDDRLVPGMIAELTIPETVAEGALIIPTQALVEEDGSTFVYLVEENSAVKTKITPVETQTEETAVEGEIEPGDQVVTTGQSNLSDEDTVEVVEGE